MHFVEKYPHTLLTRASPAKLTLNSAGVLRGGSVSAPKFLPRQPRLSRPVPDVSGPGRPQPPEPWERGSGRTRPEGGRAGPGVLGFTRVPADAADSGSRTRPGPLPARGAQARPGRPQRCLSGPLRPPQPAKAPPHGPAASSPPEAPRRPPRTHSDPRAGRALGSRRRAAASPGAASVAPHRPPPPPAAGPPPPSPRSGPELPRRRARLPDFRLTLGVAGKCPRRLPHHLLWPFLPGAGKAAPALLGMRRDGGPVGAGELGSPRRRRPGTDKIPRGRIPRAIAVGWVPPPCVSGILRAPVGFPPCL